jgi:2-polyprenyl-6-methoxyphenol hydroxylase-like FAD-dependent oxidoreductase
VTAMRIAVVGGGPGGLFFATLIRRADPAVEVTVFERNRADDAFGFGVVFSDRTLAGIHDADPVLREALTAHGRHWDDIEVRLKGERIRCGGNGMAAVARRTLLALMQERARAVGATLRFSTEATLPELAGFDLVVAADGAGSRLRESLAQRLDSSVDTATAKFIWFGTDYLFDGLTFVHEHGPHGVFAVHGYPISDDVSTFIVECDEPTWRAAGLDAFDVTQPPGPSDTGSKEYLEKLFAEQIDGHRLLVNNSRWGNFRTRRTRRWHTLDPRPVALLGDAVHSAHFSVGSGTKMAMEDAIELARQLGAHRDLPTALAAYQDARTPAVARIQDAAVPSLAWWERFGQYQRDLDPFTFAFHFFSRSIAVDRIARRDPDLVATARARWAEQHGTDALHTPLDLAGVRRAGRVLELSEVDGITRVDAPDDESHLAKAAHSLPDGGAVVISGGTALTRVLLSEEARLRRGLVSVVVDDLSDAAIETALLAGRADAVARPQGEAL